MIYDIKKKTKIMSISSKIALAMSADGASFEEVHNSLEKIVEDFAVKYAEWCCARAIGVTHFKLNEEELEQFKNKEYEKRNT